MVLLRPLLIFLGIWSCTPMAIGEDLAHEIRKEETRKEEIHKEEIHKEDPRPVTEQPKPEMLPLILESFVDRAQATTKEVITYSITLKRREELKEVQLPDMGVAIQGFRITQFGSEEPITEDGYVITKKWYKLIADLSGSYVLPPVEISYTKEDGSFQTAKTSEIFVEILKPGTTPSLNEASTDETRKDPQNSDVTKEMAQDEGLRDIHPPISMGLHPYWWIAMSGLALLATAVLLGWFYQMRKSRKVKISPPLPAHQVALARLEQLERRLHVDSIDLKNYHFELSELLREYLEAHLNLPLTDRTTEEITEMISSTSLSHSLSYSLSHSLSPELCDRSLQTLRSCDVVKFTDYMPSKEKALTLKDETYKIIQETMPKSALHLEEAADEQGESVL